MPDMINMEVTQRYDIVHQKYICHEINHKTAKDYFNKLGTLSPYYVVL
jgi:hypothetical protein